MSKTYFLIKLEKQKKRKPDFTIISHNIGGQTIMDYPTSPLGPGDIQWDNYGYQQKIVGRWEKKFFTAYTGHSDYQERGTFNWNDRYSYWNEIAETISYDKLKEIYNEVHLKHQPTISLLQEVRLKDKQDLYIKNETSLIKINDIIQPLSYYDKEMEKNNLFFPIATKGKNTVINEIFQTNHGNNKFGFKNNEFYEKYIDKTKNHLNRMEIKEVESWNGSKFFFYIINIHGIIITKDVSLKKLFEHLLIYETIKKFLDKFDNVIIGGDFNIELNKIFEKKNKMLSPEFKDIIKSIYKKFFIDNKEAINFFTTIDYCENAKKYIDYHQNQLIEIFEKCSYGEEKYNMSGCFTNAWTLKHEDETQYPNGHEEGIKKNVDYILVSNKLKEKYDLKWYIDNTIVYTKEKYKKTKQTNRGKPPIAYVNDFDHAVVKLEMFKK